MTFTILGPPRTKKTHQRIFRNRRTGAPLIVPAAASKDWEASAVMQLRSRYYHGAYPIDGACLRLKASIDVPVAVRALVYRDANRGDLVGYLQAIGDALERSGVIVNDRLIASWDGSRLLVDRERPRVEIEIGPTAGAPALDREVKLNQKRRGRPSAV